MTDAARRLLLLALERGALRFGEFRLKSGRESPFFFDIARLSRGDELATLGEVYLETLERAGLPFDMLFGPPYKGIALATALALAYARRGRALPIVFARKEPKLHGEGGTLYGARPAGRVLIVDDVLTAGTAAREAVSLLRAAGAEPAGLIVALDREERGADGKPAAERLAGEIGAPVLAVARLRDLIALLGEREEDRAALDALMRYRERERAP
ncbi:MAG: orotate phosphoribosyltransferase [Xanthomonadales bacterium]|nr:orotate phosphoribosyltransferase [Xanthomonadales bacterium]